MKKIQVDYSLFLRLCRSLYDEVRARGTAYSSVLCPLRGGYYLSNFMSRHLELPVLFLEISSYRGREQGEFILGRIPDTGKGPCLICDDIYDSGATVTRIHQLYPDVEFSTACLVSKKQRQDIMYGMMVDPDIWVDFFWETD